MIKKIIFIMLVITFQISFACPQALPTDDEGFCPSFKVSALCYCTKSGLPKGFCNNVSSVHRRMISFFGSLEKACNHQTYTSAQTCIDNWTCYLNGGNDSNGRPCAGTANSCESTMHS